MKEFYIGKKKLSSNILYAPLAGCSDFPFRKMSAKYRPALMFCEMVKMEALVRGIPETREMLAFSEEMRPIGGQICGSNPALAAQSAKIIEDLGFDTLDFNCGCPVDKVTKDGSGSAMLKNPELIGEMLANMVAAVRIPVTVKIRTGWDELSINAPVITKIAEDAGASAITIHGRTRAQAYKGAANWDHIKASKQVATKIKVIGNGDLFDAKSALRMLEETGCDGVLIARGTMGQPWIIEDILRLKQGLEPLKRGFKEYREALLEHLSYSMQFKSEKGALIDMRKVSCWYLKEIPGARELRAQASHATSIDEVKKLIHGLSDEGI